MSESWKKELHGCFGLMGASFALHPNDKKRADKLARLAREQGVKYVQIIEEAERYLIANGYKPEKRQKLLFGVEEYFRNID